MTPVVIISILRPSMLQRARTHLDMTRAQPKRSSWSRVVVVVASLPRVTSIAVGDVLATTNGEAQQAADGSS
ncbi:hypothetical protein GGF50DRAFT_121967 [Schizophyllum commune]